LKQILNKYNKIVLCTPKKYLYKKGIPLNSITSISKGIKFAEKIDAEELSIHYAMIKKLKRDNYDNKIYV